MKRDNFAHRIDKFTRVGAGDGIQFGDDSFLPDTDVVKKLLTTLDNSVRDVWFLEQAPCSCSCVLPSIASGNISRRSCSRGKVFVNEEALALREFRVRAVRDEREGFDRFICHCV